MSARFLSFSRFIAHAVKPLWMALFFCPLMVAGGPVEDRASLILDTLRAQPMLTPGGSGKLPYGHAVARLVADPADAGALAYVAGSGMGGEPPFNGLYMIRGYLLTPESYSSSQKASIQAYGEAVEEWNLDYTENHRVLLWTIAYLMAQAFPDGTWKWNGQSVSSQVLLTTVRDTLVSYGRSVYSQGYNELLSTTYDLYKVSAWMCLYDLAEDSHVRDMADAMLTYHLTLIALASYEEIILPPHSRSQGVQTSDLSADSQWIHWFFWGHGGGNAAQAVRAYSPEWILALTTWRPPELVNRLALGEVEMPYSFFTQQPFFYPGDPLQMMRTSYREPAFAISSGVYRMDIDQLGVHGARQLVHDDAFGLVWDSGALIRSLSVMHPYWEAGSGEQNWNSRSSPFMQVVQSRNTALIAFDIPVEDPWADVEPWAGTRAEAPIPLAQIRYPSAGVAYSGDWGNDWVSLDTGSAYIAIKILQPGWGQNRRLLANEGFHLLQSRGVVGERWKTGFLIEVRAAADYASLADFMAEVMAQPLAAEVENGSVVYTSTLGDQLEMQFTVSLEIPDFSVPGFSLNGQPVDFTEWPHLASPWTRVEGNVLKLATLDPLEEYVVDWSGTFPVLEYREVTTGDPTWGGWPKLDGWVDTGSFMGWIFIMEDGYVYSLSLGKAVYLPEEYIGPNGAWVYVP